MSDAMTVHRSQGQTFNTVGIYLLQHVFPHGQFYKALSRATTQENIFIKINKNINQGQILKHSNRLYTSTIFLIMNIIRHF